MHLLGVCSIFQLKKKKVNYKYQLSPELQYSLKFKFHVTPCHSNSRSRQIKGKLLHKCAAKTTKSETKTKAFF